MHASILAFVLDTNCNIVFTTLWSPSSTLVICVFGVYDYDGMLAGWFKVWSTCIYINIDICVINDVTLIHNHIFWKNINSNVFLGYYLELKYFFVATVAFPSTFELSFTIVCADFDTAALSVTLCKNCPVSVTAPLIDCDTCLDGVDVVVFFCLIYSCCICLSMYRTKTCYKSC